MVGEDYPQHTHMMQYFIQHKFSDHFFNCCIFIWKSVSLLQYLHLITMAYTTFSSSLRCHNIYATETWQIPLIMKELVIYLVQGYFAVCSIMERKGNHWIVSFIEVDQYGLLSWWSYTSASIFFSYAAASRLSFHSWSNVGWFISFDKG